MKRIIKYLDSKYHMVVDSDDGFNRIIDLYSEDGIKIVVNDDVIEAQLKSFDFLLEQILSTDKKFNQLKKLLLEIKKEYSPYIKLEDLCYIVEQEDNDDEWDD